MIGDKTVFENCALVDITIGPNCHSARFVGQLPETGDPFSLRVDEEIDRAFLERSCRYRVTIERIA